MNIEKLKLLTAQLNERDLEIQQMSCIMRAICDGLPDLMIWAKDSGGKYLFVNKAVCEHLLITEPLDIIGQTDMDVDSREQTKQPENPEYHTFGMTCYKSDQQVLTTGKPFRIIEEGYVQGKKMTIDVRKYPLMDNCNLIGVVGCARVVVVGERRWDD